MHFKNSTIIAVIVILFLTLPSNFQAVDAQSPDPRLIDGIVSINCQRADYLMNLMDGTRQEPSQIDPSSIGIQAQDLTLAMLDGNRLTDRLVPEQRIQLWNLNVAAPENMESTVEISLIDVFGSGIEYQLYRGNTPVSDDLGDLSSSSDQTLKRFPVGEPGIYTLAVRRLDLSTIANEITYSIEISYPESTALILSGSVVDQNDRGTPIPVTTLPSGLNQVTEVNSIRGRLLVQAGMFQPSANPQTLSDNDSTSSKLLQIIFGNDYRIRVSSWAQYVHLLGGELLVVGEEISDDTPAKTRLVYFENLDTVGDIANTSYGEDTTGALSRLQDASGAGYILNSDLWQHIDGIWFTTTCLGLQLETGQRVLIELDSTERGVIEIGGTVDNFLLNVPNPRRRIVFDWRTIAEGDPISDSQAQVYLGFDYVAFSLAGHRSLLVATNTLSLFPWLDAPATAQDMSIPVDVMIDTGEQAQQLKIDWTAIRELHVDGYDSLLDSQLLRMRFRDTHDGLVNRDNELGERRIGRLQSLSVDNDVITIISDPTANDLIDNRMLPNNTDPQSIEAIHRKLLPAQESYLELVMLEGTPAYYGRSLPGMSTYVPRGSNNLGGECHTINTMLPELNCAPNGHVNPANGNLWFNVTDLSAKGAYVDLSLTRSYNSMSANLDGPFGFGWQAGIRVDYVVAFSTQQYQWSRLVDFRDPASFNNYPVALDLAWAPGGYITFTTMSGSRHQFRQGVDPDIYYGVNVPNERITLTTLENGEQGWQLQQSDGFTYNFDRAGRLKSYGYPHLSRWFTFDYTDQQFSGPAFYENGLVTLTDAASLRQIELYFDVNHHVTRTVLRPTQHESSMDCLLDNACFENTYTVDAEGSLTDVVYADKTFATYRYHDAVQAPGNSLMCYHSDPKAPELISATYNYRRAPWPAFNIMPDILPIMEILYSEVGYTGANCPQQALGTTWRTLDWARGGDDFLDVNVIHNQGNIASYRYLQGLGDINTPGNIFALEEYHPSQIADAGYSFSYDWNAITGQLLYHKQAGTHNSVSNEATRFTYIDPIDNGYSLNLLTEMLNETTNRLYAGLPTFTVNATFNSDAFLYLPEHAILTDRSTVKYTYDEASLQPSSMTDVNGLYSDIMWLNGVVQSRIERDVFSSGIDVTHTYDYDNIGALIGFPSRYSRSLELDSFAYFVEYEWDALGRPIMLDYSDLGTYHVNYIYLPGDCIVAGDECVVLHIVITDPTGAMTTYKHDTLGRVTDILVADGTKTLRHTSYLYHPLNKPMISTRQLRASIEWLSSPTTIPELPCPRNDLSTVSGLSPSVTCYEYTPIDGGYSIKITDAIGRESIYNYDIFDRVTAIVLPDGNHSRYTYTTQVDNVVGTASVPLDAELQITEQRTTADGNFTLQYFFNRYRQIRFVGYIPPTGNILTWTFTYNQAVDNSDVISYYLTQLETSGQRGAFGRRTIVWEDPTQSDQTPSIQILNTGVDDLVSGDRLPRLGMDEQHNNGGLLVEITAGIDTGSDSEEVQTSHIMYCPRDGGLIQIYYIGIDIIDLSCNETAISLQQFQNAVPNAWYDAHDRLVCDRVPALGTRSIAYEVATEANHPYQQRVTTRYYRNATCSDLLLGTALFSAEMMEITYYNAAGDLLSHTDANGYTQSYCYDQRGRLLQVRQASECSANPVADPVESAPDLFIFQYNTADQLTREQRPDGTITDYEYNSAGQLILQQSRSEDEPSTLAQSQVGLIALQTVTYIYDINGRLVEQIAPNGDRYTYSYDIDPETDATIFTVTDPARGEHVYSWNDAKLDMVYKDPRGNITVYDYDALGLLWQIEDNIGRQHALTYNSLGNPTSWARAQRNTNPESSASYVELSGTLENNNLVVNPIQSPWQLILNTNALGHIETSNVGMLNDRVQLDYDPLGRVQNMSVPFANWSFTRPSGTQLVEYMLTSSGPGQSEANESVSVALGFDESYRLTSYNDPSTMAEPITYTYSVGGETTLGGESLVQVETSNGTRYIRYIPNQLPTRLRFGTVAYAMGEDVPESGQPVNGASNDRYQYIEYEFDDRGRIQQISIVTHLLDTAESVPQTWTQTSRIQYDERGRPTSTSDGGQHVETFSYDPSGNLVTYQNRNGNTYRYQYDTLNRLSRLITPTDSSFYFSYNDLDLVVGICRTDQFLQEEAQRTYQGCSDNGKILEQYAYDSLGRMTHQVYDVVQQENEAISVGTYAYGFDYQQPDFSNSLLAWGHANPPDLDDLNALNQPVEWINFANDLVEFEYSGTIMNQATAINTGNDGSIISIEYDAYGQIRQVASPNSQYDYTYNGIGHLANFSATSNETLYDFDYHYTHNDDGLDVAQRILPDGSIIQYTIGDAGLITEVAIVVDNTEQSLFDIVNQVDTGRNQLRAGFAWAEKFTLVSGIQINTANQVASTIFSSENLGELILELNYQREATGSVRQQQVDATLGLVPSISGSALGVPNEVYLITINYDRNQQPTTLRLTNRTGQPIYTLIYNYDSAGRIVRETRRFRNGRQQVINYTYGANDVETPQLTHIEIQLLGEDSARVPLNSEIISLMGIGLLALVFLRRRKWIVVSVVATLFGISFVFAQSTALIFELDYDTDGNVTAIRLSDSTDNSTRRCEITYTYDTANRLTSVTRIDGLLDSVQRFYSYDGFNRLAQIRTTEDETNDIHFIYEGTNSHPSAIQTNEQSPTYIERLSGDIQVFQLGSTGTVTPIIFDGDQGILQSFNPAQDSKRIWIFDPQHRLIPLTDEEVNELIDSDGCLRLFPHEADVNQDDILFFIDQDSLWDPIANLYFTDGRVYNPEINQFLQRDPSGVNVRGNSYTYPQNDIQLPAQPYTSSYISGMTEYDDALSIMNITQDLTTQAIRQRYKPIIPGTLSNSFVEAWSDVVDYPRDIMQEQLRFSEWLAGGYNASNILFDIQTGLIQLPDTTSIGHAGGLTSTSSYPTTSVYGQYQVAPTYMSIFDPNAVQRAVTMTPVSTFNSQLWRMTTHSPLDLEQPANQVSTITPSDIIEWLVLPTPPQSTATIDLIAELQLVQGQSLQDWSTNILTQVLPKAPEIPPISVEELKEDWFTNDIFGVADSLAGRNSYLTEITPPQYGITPQMEWLLPPNPYGSWQD